MIILLILLCYLCIHINAIPVTLLHLTDVHGYINGHTHMPELNADFGDLYNFLYHMRTLKESLGEDLLVMDTGDLIEGTGLSDATKIHGEYIFNIAEKIPYSALTVGNHDLGYNATIDYMRSGLIKVFGDSYVTTNTYLNGYKHNNNQDNNNNNEQDNLSSCYYHLKTSQGIKILILGFIYDFDQNSENTRIEYMDVSVNSLCFKQAMISSMDVDIIITLNHIDPQDQNDTLKLQYNSIREYYPKTPLILLTGHRHVTYYEVFDDYCFTIESGKYFETIGYITFDYDTSNKTWTNLDHKFINTNVDTLQYYSKSNNSTFDTIKGNLIKKQIMYYYNKLNLGTLYGCSPTTLSPYVPITDPTSLYYIYINEIVPLNYVSYEADGLPFFITNSAALRALLYSGNVVLDDLFSVCPFNDTYYHITGLNGKELGSLISELISNDPNKLLLNQEHIIHNSMNSSVYNVFSKELRYRHSCNNVQASLNKNNNNNADVLLVNKDPQPLNYSNFFFSDEIIIDTEVYDVICVDYDAFIITMTLSQLYPDVVYTPEIYKGALNNIHSTDLLGYWVSKTYPCNDDDQE